MMDDQDLPSDLSGHLRLLECDNFLDQIRSLADASDDQVLSTVACFQIRDTIHDYLLAFMEIKNHHPPRNPTPDKLIRMCQEIHQDFRQIDLGTLRCSCTRQVGQSCRDIEHIRTCQDLAIRVGTIVHRLVDDEVATDE